MCKHLPDHLEHASQMLAENTATLHHMECPGCPDFRAFPCVGGGHWHVGHPNKAAKRQCLAVEDDYFRGQRRDDTPA